MFKYVDKKLQWNQKLYIEHNKNPSACSLFTLLLFSSWTGLWIYSENKSCPHKGQTLVMVIVLPETKVVFFFTFRVVLGIICCRRNRKWRLLGLSVQADPPADQEAAEASAEHSDVRSWVQSPGVVPRSRTLPSLNSVIDFRVCRG